MSRPDPFLNLLKDFGYQSVHNLGGFKDWADGGGEVEKAS